MTERQNCLMSNECLPDSRRAVDSRQELQETKATKLVKAYMTIIAIWLRYDYDEQDNVRTNTESVQCLI